MRKKIFFPLLASLLAMTSCSLSGQHHEVEDYMFDMDYHDHFRILQLSDMHISSYDDITEDLNYMDYLVNDAKKETVDLLVVTGDIFTFASKATIRHVMKHIDSWNIPWTFIFGNHDEQVYASYTYVAEYGAKMKNALFHFYQDDLTGLTNNIINLKDPTTKKTKVQLFALDSNTYSYSHGISYDYVHEDQMEWYKEGVTAVNKEVYGSSWKAGDEAVTSYIFQHIPLPEFTTADEEYNDGKGTLIGTGWSREDPCPPAYNSGFFDVIKEYKSTKAMFVGHDHVNNFDVTYEDGIHLVYGAKSTDNIYHDDDMLGYRMITLTDENNFTTDLHYFTYEEAVK